MTYCLIHTIFISQLGKMAHDSLRDEIEEKDALTVIRRVKVADIFNTKEEAIDIILRTATMEWPMLGNKFCFQIHRIF
jgi:hypothetical protein